MRKSNPLLFMTVTILFASCTSTMKQSSCEDFKTGRFEMHSELDNTITTIDRMDSIQTERNNIGEVGKWRIKWTGDCEYELISITQTTNSADTMIAFFQTRPIKTTIIQTGKGYYIFKSTMDGVNATLVDTLRVVK